jgi:hypothetical protein
MRFIRHHKILSALGAVALIIAFAFIGTGIYVASVAGDLPWQTDPTRVADSITPFAGLEVFIPATTVPAASVATPTPTP